LNVARLIEKLDLKGKRIRWKRNGEIGPRSKFDRVRLPTATRSEIVVAVGGG